MPVLLPLVKACRGVPRAGCLLAASARSQDARLRPRATTDDTTCAKTWQARRTRRSAVSLRQTARRRARPTKALPALVRAIRASASPGDSAQARLNRGGFRLAKRLRAADGRRG